MSDAQTYDQSLTSHVKAIDAGEHVVHAAFLNGKSIFALASGDMLVAGEGKRVAAHPGATLLVAVSDGKRIVSGGDDGRIV
ncbi:MAG: hypothetical protein FJX29_08930, partial [Alphaproteobacteria bacterium]|nr:hypothetical protein [Alphaproteobacteria bacterium]